MDAFEIQCRSLHTYLSGPIANLSDSVFREDKTRGRNLTCLRWISRLVLLSSLRRRVRGVLFANLPSAAIVQNAICSRNGPFWICVSIPEIKQIRSLDEEVSPLNETLRLNGAPNIDLMTQHLAAPRAKTYTRVVPTSHTAARELEPDLHLLSLSLS